MEKTSEPRHVQCAICDKNIYVGDRGLRIQLPPDEGRYICWACYEKVGKEYKEWESRHPEELATITIRTEERQVSDVEWHTSVTGFEWEGDENLPVKISNFLLATIPLSQWPFKLIKVAECIEEDAGIYRRDLVAELKEKIRQEKEAKCEPI